MKEHPDANRIAAMPFRVVITGLAVVTRPRSNSIESDHGLEFWFEHDLIRKPVSTFRDHALEGASLFDIVDRKIKPPVRDVGALTTALACHPHSASVTRIE